MGGWDRGVCVGMEFSADQCSRGGSAGSGGEGAGLWGARPDPCLAHCSGSCWVQAAACVCVVSSHFGCCWLQCDAFLCVATCLSLCCLQEGGSVRPGWVKMRYTVDGVSVAWHPAAHPLSLPVALAAVPNWPLEPVGEELLSGWDSQQQPTPSRQLSCSCNRRQQCVPQAGQVLFLNVCWTVVPQICRCSRLGLVNPGRHHHTAAAAAAGSRRGVR